MTDPHAPSHSPAHTPDPLSVAVELERLRGTMEAGFARVDGSLALLVQRSDQTDRQLADHEARLDALERARWPLASVTAMAAVSAIAMTAWQITAR
ncbi:hypothetical protein [Streptomyces sp. TBY4]|uniref:hypothetical protein n=1 Tax=Streptomyces sp. TBY4 TaxID=2962030 RepID=UPI0020B79512|nr:hypothetical protein [Streptomyces sp. TBY4]MCP3760153.1 hypothetical protein [Streptomyces sp. TBY4]